MFNFLKRRAFKKEFDRAVEDGILTKAESQSLESHGVDQAFVNKTRTEHYLKVTEALRREIEGSQRMSPAQEAQLLEFAENLGITPQFDDNYQIFRELWAADNGEEIHLAPIDVDILLQNGEVCVFSQSATWAQVKTMKTRSGYSGFSTSVRLVKGVSYRVGNYKPHYTESEQLQVQDAGRLFLTNKRIFFKGDKKSTTIQLGRIIDVEPYTDGLEVTKDRGTNDSFLMARVHSEFCCMALQQMLAR